MAKGSQKTYGGWESKRCAVCDAKLTLSGSTAVWCNDEELGSFGVCSKHTIPEARAAVLHQR